MDNQIQMTINAREELMGEYVKTRIETDIIGGNATMHKVKLIVRGENRGAIWVGKDAFQNWLKERMKGGK